jgi:hypothetical protein
MPMLRAMPTVVGSLNGRPTGGARSGFDAAAIVRPISRKWPISHQRPEEVENQSRPTARSP